MMFQRLKSWAAIASLATMVVQSPVHAAGASTALSDASQLSTGLVLSGASLIALGAATLTVVSVQQTAEGVSWVVERASDGARSVVRFVARGAGMASVAVGTVVTTTAMASGTLLSVAGQAIAFVPTEVGKALLHNERLSD